MHLFKQLQNTNIITLPGSKSIINRLLTLALYHDIELHIENINLCDDVKDMLGVYDAVGKRYEICGTELRVFRGFADVGDEVNITISGSGTCLRFVLPFLALVFGKKCHISLGERLSQRPLKPLIDCLVKAVGTQFIASALSVGTQFIASVPDDPSSSVGTQFIASTLSVGTAFMPSVPDDPSSSVGTQFIASALSVGTPYMPSARKPIDCFEIDSTTSSQFLSSLLLYTSFYKETKILQTDTMNGVPNSSYIRMTKEVIKLLPLPHSTLSLKLDPDYSTACYIWLYSYLMQKEIYIAKLTNIYQPDYKFVAIMWDLGISFIEKEGYISVSSDSSFPCEIKSFSVDMSDLPDQIITLVFLCLVAGVHVEISGCGSLRYKESDRIAGILENVALLGGEASFTNDMLYVEPLQCHPSACVLKTYHDHRFAFVFWVLSQKYPYLEVDDVGCIKKSI